MDCPQRQRLFDSYYDLVSREFEMLEPSRLDSERIRDLARLVEEARVALESHEREHGCGWPLRSGS